MQRKASSKPKDLFIFDVWQYSLALGFSVGSCAQLYVLHLNRFFVQRLVLRSMAPSLPFMRVVNGNIFSYVVYFTCLDHVTPWLVEALQDCLITKDQLQPRDQLPLAEKGR